MTEDLKSQVESRLNELFGEDDDSMNPTERFGVGDHPLKELKAILLSVEWEITDSSMESLLKELKSLEEFYQEDKLILVFIRLLNAIGKYIKVRKSKAHPNATSVLTSVYNGLETVALSEGMSRKEKERILLQEVEKFKVLKEEVIRRKKEQEEEEEKAREAAPPSEAVGPLEEKAPSPELPEMASNELLKVALEEIKKVIREEFKALRAEIKR